MTIYFHQILSECVLNDGYINFRTQCLGLTASNKINQKKQKVFIWGMANPFIRKMGKDIKYKKSYNI